MKNIRIVVTALFVGTFALLGQTVSNADQPQTSSVQSNQIVDKTLTNITPFDRGPSGVTKAASGYCYLQATNVHYSSSTFGSIAADALVTCTGTSIRISSLSVTLYKFGSIPHYLVGANLAGTAYPSKPFQYNIFKTLCSNQTSSLYWSVATAHGTYSDGSDSYAMAISPIQPLSCGTIF